MLTSNASCQVIALVPHIYSIALPASVKALLDSITVVVSISFGFAATPMQCMGLGGYLPWLVLTACTPLVLMGLAPLLAC